ncbi:MAG: DegT/DnrJ/EryC1/StrS family aminotransferase [Planctomycetota bacterium]|nr:DegT/DnrJ/EryC1/StrS family aminotransferase [Planctomycetota bacterium]
MTKEEASPFLVFGAPLIEQAEIDEVIDCLHSGWLGTGPKVAKFEQDFATYKGVDQAVALNSCTAALHLSLIAAGIGHGDEVITTPLTFCATINAIIHTGATPVLADVDPITMNIDPAQVEAKITPKTKAILPVHFAGRPCDMDGLMAIAQRYDLLIIEDCAHAIETQYKGRPAGTMGDFGCFSFYVTKNVATGEGGMVIARNEEQAARIKTLALHGLSRDAWKRFSDEGYKHYHVTEAGFKCNMMDLQAAIGLHQLARVEENWTKRESLWAFYQEALADLPITKPAQPDANTKHGLHLYTILIDERVAGISRDAFLDSMNRKRIGTGVHYLSIPEHPYYQDRFDWEPHEFPNANRIGSQTVSLPFSAKVTQAEATRVVDAVRQFVASPVQHKRAA